MSQSVSQPVRWTVSPPVSQLICQSVSRSICQSVCQSARQSGSLSVIQSINQLVNQSVSQEPLWSSDSLPWTSCVPVLLFVSLFPLPFFVSSTFCHVTRQTNGNYFVSRSVFPLYRLPQITVLVIHITTQQSASLKLPPTFISTA